MSVWEEQIERARGQFLERFAALGFTVRSSTRIYGEIQVPGYDLPIPVEIVVPNGFPFEKPKVKPTDGSGGASWHRERDHSLCLWADEETGDLPWVDPGHVVQRTREWFEKDLQGWPDDPPDLDLERYWPRGEGLVIYEDISVFVGNEVVLHREGHGVLRVRPHLRGSRSGKSLRALVVDAGELAVPLRTTEDVLECSGTRRIQLEWDLSHGRAAAVLITYSRSGLPGLLALIVTNTNPLEFAAIPAAHCGPGTIRLRRGPDSEVLADRRVAVVGVGAVGSVAADLLARAGIGRMTLVDDDVIRPGNCVRHLVDSRYVGWSKVDAVRDWIVQRGLMAATGIETRRQNLKNPEETASLLNSHDLVLDATANQLATALLISGGKALQRLVVSVCLQNDGTMVRVDRVPLREAEIHAPPVEPARSSGVELREGGCGDPISPTAMWAVVRAASEAVAVVCDLLSGRMDSPPSVVAELPTAAHADMKSADDAPTASTRPS